MYTVAYSNKVFDVQRKKSAKNPIESLEPDFWQVVTLVEPHVVVLEHVLRDVRLLSTTAHDAIVCVRFQRAVSSRVWAIVTASRHLSHPQ